MEDYYLDKLVSVDRSGLHVVVKTFDHYAKMVANAISQSEDSKHFLTAIPGKNTILFIATKAEGAKALEKSLNSQFRDYLDRARGDVALHRFILGRSIFGFDRSLSAKG